MKSCPKCRRTYTDEALNFCLEDGTPLTTGPSPLENETQRYVAPPTQVYHPAPPVYLPPTPVINRPPQPPPQYGARYSPLPPPQRKKSSAIWWVLGGIVVLVVIGVGATVMILALASINSQSNSNRVVANTNVNRNTNSNRWSNSNSNANANTSTPLPASFSDDFSAPKWTVDKSDFGELWYDNDEYHMRSKDKTYLVMYAPSNDYNTENATVKVTVRNVDGISPTTGYGLIVHGERSKEDNLEDYAFLIFSGDNPQYKVLMHKGGKEEKMVDWTPSTVIRKGTATNALEVRIKGSVLSFVINGQPVTSISDTANFKRGRAGFYTSDTHEVSFDDLEITR